jgi:hypothetical protein
MNPEKKFSLKNISLLGLGVLGGLVFALFLMDFDFVRTIGKREQVRNYDLFNPLHNGKTKHVLLSNCLTINNVAYTDLWNKKPDQTLRTGTAYYDQVLNYLLDKEYGNKEALFYGMGSPDIHVTEHLFQLGHILKAKNVKTIVYSNLRGGLHSFYEKDPKMTLQASIILEGWKKTFPEAQDHIDRYLKKLYASSQFRKAKNKNYSDAGEPRIFPQGTRPWRENLSVLFASNPFKKVSSLRNFSIRNFSHIKTSGDLEWEQTLERNLEKNLALYESSMNDRTFRVWDRTSKLSFDPQKKPSYADFLHILASISKQKGIQLVYYFPPMLSISPEDYHQTFTPRFIDPIKRIIEPYGALIIDHTINHDLNQYDIYWKMRKHPSNGWKRGYQTNIIGNIKRGRTLIEEMVRLGLIDNTPRKENLKPWARSALPQIPLKVESRFSRKSS